MTRLSEECDSGASHLSLAVDKAKRTKTDLESECAKIEMQMFNEDLAKAYKQIGAIETPNKISLHSGKQSIYALTVLPFKSTILQKLNALSVFVIYRLKC